MQHLSAVAKGEVRIFREKHFRNTHRGSTWVGKSGFSQLLRIDNCGRALFHKSAYISQAKYGIRDLSLEPSSIHLCG